MIKVVCYTFFFYFIWKMSEFNSIETTYYQRNRDVILDRAKKDKKIKQEINIEIY